MTGTRRQSVGVLCAVSLWAVSVGLSGPPDVRKAIDKAVKGVYPALVRIHVVTVAASGGRMKKFAGSGSGTIISKEGHVLTNHHVARRARRLLCRLANREELEAKLVATDALTDLAVLKLDLSGRKDKSSPLPVARFGDSGTVRVGDTVLAMGSPAGLSQSVTQGIVSNTEMISPTRGGLRLDGESVGTLVRWIGHDAVIYPGNSGGPLVNLRGEIIGVNEVGIGSLAGAIPSDLARNVARQLIETGKVTRSWTGLVSQPLLKSMPDATGVLLAGVIKDSPAAKAGIQPGDVLTRFDGVAVHSRVREELPVFNRLVLATPVGKKVRVVLRRDGKPKRFDLVTIPREAARGKDRELRDWGITARDLTRISALARMRADQRGVLVHTLRPGGPCNAAKPSIGPGDVIVEVRGEPVANVAALRKITRDITRGHDEPQPVLVAFDRARRKLLTVVEVGRPGPEDRPSQAKKAWLGVATQVLTRKLAKAMKLAGKPGVRVTQVFAGTTARQAGLKVGDIILKLDGEVVPARQPEDHEVFAHRIRQYKIGATVELDLVRGGQRRKLAVKLQAQPTPPAELKQYKDEDFEFTARELSFDDRVQRHLTEADRGVLIQSVQTAGWAALAGLAPGSVLLRIDDKPVGDVAALEKIMEEIRRKRPKRVVFFVRRGILTVFVELEPNWPPAEPARRPETRKTAGQDNLVGERK